MNPHPFSDLFGDAGALFGPRRVHRYVLWRKWGEGAPLHMTLLNPSTADEFKNDPTIERQCRRAKMMGFAGLILTNAYAFRSTDPKALYHADDPIGPDNDVNILNAARRSPLTVVGWGKHCDAVRPDRAKTILEMFWSHGIMPHALKRNGDGSPQHPLYLPYDLAPQPIEWRH